MKLGTVTKKEYREIVRKKSFIISTVLTPLLMTLFIFLPMLLFKLGKGEKRIAVADFSGFVFARLAAAEPLQPLPRSDISNALETGGREWEDMGGQITFINVPVAGTSAADLEAEFAQKILTQAIDGFLLIPADIRESRRVRYYAANISDFNTNKFISSTIRAIVTRGVLLDMRIDPVVVEEASRDIRLETFKVKKAGATRTSSGLEYMMSLLMLTVLFSVIMGYGQLIMRGIIEEKNSRIMEILISSARASTLFYGKIAGIGLAGLTQVSIWMLFGAAILGRFASGLDPGLLAFLTPEIAIYFIIFFTLGYFMYAILFSIIGAAVNTDHDAQQYAAPLVYLLLIPFFIGMIVTQNPNSPLAVAASFFPLFSPILMFMRITVMNPGWGQILLAIALNVAAIFFLAWLGAKIFRVGILMYGKKPSPKEILRWARYR